MYPGELNLLGFDKCSITRCEGTPDGGSLMTTRVRVVSGDEPPRRRLTFPITVDLCRSSATANELMRQLEDGLFTVGTL